MTGTYLRSNGGNAIRLAKAVKLLADEHGLPNAFRASECAQLAGLNNMQVGKLCSSHFTRATVVDECARLGVVFSTLEKRPDGTYLACRAPEHPNSV